MSLLATTLRAYLEPQLPAYIEELRQLCAIECPTASKAGVDAAGAWVRRWAAQRGWETRMLPDAEVGDGVLLSIRGGRPGGLRVLLAAHLDTVYPVGVAATRPLRREGDRLVGPGSADNKSGLLSALYAMAALADCGLLAELDAVALYCGGDEETDMRASTAQLRELAAGFELALVLEAGRENGDIVLARKGQAQLRLDVVGKSAHAGVEPHKGANAIMGLAMQLMALQALNGLRPGITINVGVVGGGTQSNVVPAQAWAEIDARFVLAEDRAALAAAIEQIAATTYVPGTTATLGANWSAPLPPTPAGRALTAIASACAHELGFEVAGAATGGLSYANLLAELGLPTLDGLGPVGGLDHSPDEYILESSIVPRSALLALVIVRAAEQRAIWSRL